MRINNNITALNSHRQYGINTRAISRNMERLSSGFRVNRAADDAAGLAISEKMRAQIRGLNQASRNSQDAISLVQTAEGGMQTIQDILQRMRELAVQAASDTNDEIDRKATNLEFQALMNEIDDIANTTEFNAMELLQGRFEAGFDGDDFEGEYLTIQVGANEGQTLTFSILAMNSGEVLAIDSENVLTRAAASAAILALTTAINTVSMQRAGLGALQNRLEFKIQNLDNQSENVAASESRIRDVDMAAAMTEFTRNNILFQASTAMLAQANALPQSVLQLLG